uniref:glycosyltransferase family 4 protein n=1 Tax=Nitrospira cf. moscoviensis SBR1015 TaxID=96242 RepID=UPI000B3BCEF2|nr:glycosyltransferase [Nitrospira cf. moscoviensis SBR1015]
MTGMGSDTHMSCPTEERESALPSERVSASPSYGLSMMSPSSMRNKKRPYVMVQQNCIPHYRLLLFELLSTDKQIRFRVIADENSDVPFLAVIRPEETVIDLKVARVRTLFLSMPFNLTWQPSAVAEVLRERPDLVIVQGSPYSLTAWVLVLLGRTCRIPVLLWTHGLLGQERGVRWRIRETLYRLSSGLLLYGDRAQSLLVEKGFPCERLHVVYNSVGASRSDRVVPSPEACLEFRTNLGIKTGERLVIFSGRLQREKQIPLLFQAIAGMKGNQRTVHVCLVGDGTEQDRLYRLADELGIRDLVHFLGPIYEESKLGLVFSASDLSVIPAAAGLSIIHAMTYGTPVLLHGNVEEHGPEWEAVMEGVTGFFFKHGNADDLAQKAMMALFPEPLKEKMAQACREVVEHRYTTSRHAQAIKDAVRATLMSRKA